MIKKIKLGSLLFMVGFAGIVSLLFTNIPLPTEILNNLYKKFSIIQIKLLILINPTIFLLISIIMGIIFYKKVDFKLPIFEKIVGINKDKINTKEIIKYGIFSGILSGIILSLISVLSLYILGNEYAKISKEFIPSFITRILYGGITEELLIRFGIMSFIVWSIYKVFKTKNNIIYWTGIIISSIIFGFGHFGIILNLIPKPSILLLSYILLANSIGGIVFGYVYWKKGLESSMISHIFSHISIVLITFVL